jgi:hypothetical protein
MKFTDRKEWLYNPALFSRSDTQTALKMHKEWTLKNSPQPPPRFFEVDRDVNKVDELWHYSLDDRTVFSRVLDIPCVNTHGPNEWRLTKIGLVPQRKDKFKMSNLILQDVNYFPERGDMVFYNGYRYMIINIVLDPKAYWGQTNVWMALAAEAIIPPEGDARPLIDVSQPAPAEIAQCRPLPEA